jgi:hypothetical protein
LPPGRSDACCSSCVARPGGENGTPRRAVAGCWPMGAPRQRVPGRCAHSARRHGATPGANTGSAADKGWPRSLADLWCGVVVVELRGFEPLTPCMPSMLGAFTTPHRTSRAHTTVLVRGAVEGRVVGRGEVTRSAVSGKSLAGPCVVVHGTNAGASGLQVICGEGCNHGWSAWTWPCEAMGRRWTVGDALLLLGQRRALASGWLTGDRGSGCVACGTQARLHARRRARVRDLSSPDQNLGLAEPDRSWR